MTQESKDVPDLLVTQGGFLHHGLRRIGFKLPLPLPTALAAVALSVLTWGPLLVLAAFESQRIGPVATPLLKDLGVVLRFFVALPILILADTLVEPKLAATVRHFASAGLVRDDDRSRFKAIIQGALRQRDSLLAQGLILVLAVGLSFSGLTGEQLAGVTTWHTLVTPSGSETTMTGLVYDYVSLPLYRYVMFTWIWRYIVWISFLFRTSRLQLRLVPTHPDLSGGLGFVGLGQEAMAVVLLGISTTAAGSIGLHAMHGGSLREYYPVIAAYAVFAVIIFVGPLLMFSPALGKCKRKGLYRYGALGAEYALAFEDRWIDARPSGRGELLGSADIQSLADLAGSFDIVRQMRPIPFGARTIGVVVGATVLPLLPLLLLEYDISEILSKLAHLIL